MSPPRIVFVINVDWFFCSHFLHLARRAKARGYAVSIVTNFEDCEGLLRAEGFDLVPISARRAGASPVGLGQSIQTLYEYLHKHDNVIVHGFGFFGILVGTLAARRAKKQRRVFTITGRGHSASAKDLASRITRALARGFCPRIADGPSTRWLAENDQDIKKLHLDRAAADGRVAIVGGAGVNPDAYPVTPIPARPPLRCAIVSRLVWSKGIDTAVEAVSLARKAGLDVELTIAGQCDAGNPRSLTSEQLDEFTSRPGISWMGHVEDIAALWQTQHVGLLPSRGGEGVPRSLIEAASCGRVLVSTSVAGCRELVTNSGGWVVPANDPEALSQALAEIAVHDNLDELGRRARQAVETGYTEVSVWRTCEQQYTELAASSSP